MTTSNERFQKGLEIRQRLAGGQGRVFKGSVPIAYELVPDMYRITTECLYGSIWSRPGLDIKYRAMASLAAVAALRVGQQVRSYIRNGLNLGLTPEEIVEILLLTAFYAGIPAAYNALAVTKEVFEDRGIDFTAPEIYDAEMPLEVRHGAGVEKHGELMPDVYGYYSSEPTPEEQALDEMMQEYLWGSIWTRPGLDMKSRAICTVAALVVQGRYDQTIRRVIEGALRVGVTRTEVMETIMHLAFYAGVMPARAAMNIANTVFRSPEFSTSASSGT